MLDDNFDCNEQNPIIEIVHSYSRHSADNETLMKYDGNNEPNNDMSAAITEKEVSHLVTEEQVQNDGGIDPNVILNNALRSGVQIGLPDESHEQCLINLEICKHNLERFKSFEKFYTQSKYLLAIYIYFGNGFRFFLNLQFRKVLTFTSYSIKHSSGD